MRGTEMITEIYVPRAALTNAPVDLRHVLRANGSRVVYGTIRFIERDGETALPWARERYACLVLNLHVPHTDPGQQRAAGAFRAMIDVALAHGGSYYLTYHRHARRDQLLSAYPELPDVLRAKRRVDPDERFQSEWYRHHRQMFSI